MNLQRLSDLTKISKTYLKLLELEDVEKLPALAYVRGFVYQYAKILKLSPELTANSYINNIKNKKNQHC